MTGMMEPPATQPDRRLVVFTDLHGTLLDHDTCSFAAADEALDVLRHQKVPIVLYSRRTRIEIELIQFGLRLRDPFIGENGGALLLPWRYFTFAPVEARRVDVYDVIELGVPSGRPAEFLQQVAAEFGVRVVTGTEMPAERGVGHRQCDSCGSERADEHEFDLRFRFLDFSPVEKNRLFGALHDAGLDCVKGGPLLLPDRRDGSRTSRQAIEVTLRAAVGGGADSWSGRQFR